MNTEKDKQLSELLASSQQGDKQAYARFLQETSMVLKPYIAKRLFSQDARPDVLQDTLFAIHKARHTYRPERPVGPWLYAIAEHRLIDHYRKVKRSKLNENLILEALPTEGYLGEPEDTLADKVLGLLKQLPARQRKTIEMLKLADQSIKDVAAASNMSESAVKVTAHRGYKKIRHWLGVSKK